MDTTARIERCIDRLREGDAQARDELINTACQRLERLARKMLHDSPRVRRWEDTADVLQNSHLRLHRALGQVQPANARDFFRLAAVQMRRELIDLARHYYGPEGEGAHRAAPPLQADTSGAPRDAHEPADDTHDPRRLVDWAEFHRLIAELPPNEREAFDLLWYQGLTQPEAAELLGVDPRTVRRYWQSARLKLRDALELDEPGH